ncbi:MGDG synthase family glycosyltransferase [Paenibacillus dakarensis]|uniref:MGDG synthase family glycosyltransferase n=1 Tax=Paenibacillus dakarensis TaxID=1527293 RepID=UPI0006D547DD|nr:glycosyltransferase [Paenibacillus dakarensis]
MESFKREKILILSGSLGDGHMHAAKAILEASSLYSSSVSVKVVDLMEWIHPRMHVIERYCFMQWVKHFPSLYAYLYNKTRADSLLTYLLKQFRTYSLQRLCQLIQEVNPTVLVSTFPPASAAISVLKEKGLTDLPAVTVITDHSDHSYWIHHHTDLYLVGSEEIHMALQKKGVPCHKIVITGIPVRPLYSQVNRMNQLRDKFGINPSSFVVLVMGGGWGMIDAPFMKQLQSFPLPNVQFIMICGRNVKLMHRMHEELGSKDHIQIKGYVENVHEWMAISDVLITKPGGLTTSEALASQVPMLLLDPQLGQEQDNAEYLIRKGAAMPCNMESLHETLYELIHNPDILFRMRGKAGDCKQQDSAIRAVNQIVNIMKPTGDESISISAHQYA